MSYVVMKLTVQARTATGKAVKGLRRDGQLPGVVYWKTLETPVLLSCLKNDFIKVYRLSNEATCIIFELNNVSEITDSFGKKNSGIIGCFCLVVALFCERKSRLDNACVGKCRLDCNF